MYRLVGSCLDEYKEEEMVKCVLFEIIGEREVESIEFDGVDLRFIKVIIVYIIFMFFLVVVIFVYESYKRKVL